MSTYECSSKGDKRFSAFYARLSDGRTIEEHYQCDVKGYDPGGTNWRLGKGKHPLRAMTFAEHFAEYTDLWDQYLKLNPGLLAFLQDKIREGFTLIDSFGKPGRQNQAESLTFLTKRDWI